MNDLSLKPSQSQICKYMTRDGHIRASVLIATDLIKDICDRHQPSPVGYILLGRSLIAAALLAANHKDGHRVGLDFVGRGPVGRIFAEASFEGLIRGYLQNPASVALDESGIPSVAASLGEGQLNVDLTFPGQTQPYRGMVPIQTGEIGDDVAYYLLQSQQTPSIVALSVLLDPVSGIHCGGGVLVELLPGYSQDSLLGLEANALSARSLNEMLVDDCSEDEIVKQYLGGMEFQRLEHPYPMRHACRCSKERVVNSMRLLPEPEVHQMIVEGSSTEVVCEFCKASYSVGPEDLRALLTFH